ncbi:DUF3784 domain-containing protein [Clostridium aestuarii]|uniref:DUF3784 domain-containing protein n=1 Tax=Clostridium aestuarii TaxID=338193 RepID=A0ABT4D0R6_9CLOT|nr:DUF3784 domain-containing protein [Clostridium aestuarii]MCY6484834.1 DUF3784 domain-containing protein [Clostridium aestuarii]
MFNLQEPLMIIMGFGILFFSYLIGIKKKIYLISGYNKSIKNVDKLCKSLGLSLFIIGLINILTPLLTDYVGEFIWWIYSIIVLISVIYAISNYIKET